MPYIAMDWVHTTDRRVSPAALLVLTLGVVLAGCQGDDDSDYGFNGPQVSVNQPPTVDAGDDRTVAENTDVTLQGGASDPDGDALTFSWVQTGGPAVTLDDPGSATPSFTAPEVAPGAGESLTFELSVSDGTLTAADSVIVTVQEPQPSVTISGRVNYEYVPANLQCLGLDFSATQTRPIRQATVQILDDGDTVLGTTTASDEGEYAFADIPADTEVRLRVRAELDRAGSGGWDVQVKDNYDPASSQTLGNRPLYAVEGTPFNSGIADSQRNLTATSGWDGNSYSGDRAAAPFAILDAIYSGMLLIQSADAGATFPPLDAFWSVNNTTINGDLSSGEIGTSFYVSSTNGGAGPSLFLLGDAENDTEEFDSHVVVHEWGHYFEDNFSRSDSIGGAHALGESLDARVAFGEGFATALAAMALDEPLYCDTGAAGSTQGFSINAETSSPGLQGWYNEVSVVTLLYDLFDTDNDGVDDNSLGFGPIYDTLVGPQANTVAMTTVFSFATELRSMLADDAQRNFLDAQLIHENIEAAGLDIWGSSESNDAAGNDDVLPLYTPVTADGSVTNICVNSDFDRPERSGNKLAESRFLRLTVPATATYDVLVETTTATPATADPDDRDQSDPDVYIYQAGIAVALGTSPEDNVEAFSTQSQLEAGTTYVVEIEDWRFDDEEGAPANYPERICFDVSLTAAP